MQLSKTLASIRYESCDGGRFVFRHLGYFIQVDRKQIKRKFSGRAETAGFASVGTSTIRRKRVYESAGATTRLRDPTKAKETLYRRWRDPRTVTGVSGSATAS
jgi:hypothetical protein